MLILLGQTQNSSDLPWDKQLVIILAKHSCSSIWSTYVVSGNKKREITFKCEFSKEETEIQKHLNILSKKD